jgi:hypothetical protein
LLVMEVDSVATPVLDTVPVPSGVVPMKNWTVPVFGVPAPGDVGVTVAVKVTVFPDLPGFGVTVSAVAVPALAMANVRVTGCAAL